MALTDRVPGEPTEEEIPNFPQNRGERNDFPEFVRKSP